MHGIKALNGVGSATEPRDAVNYPLTAARIPGVPL